MWGQEVGRLAVSAGCPPPAAREGSAPAARGRGTRARRGVALARVTATRAVQAQSPDAIDPSGFGCRRRRRRRFWAPTTGAGGAPFQRRWSGGLVAGHPI
jgi:hypothetical protein